MPLRWLSDDDVRAEQQRGDAARAFEALSRSQAVIEFRLDGMVETANEKFLALSGYTLDELRGKHHSTLLEAGYRASNEYRRLWESLNRGESVADASVFRTRAGGDLWLELSYAPVSDNAGHACKVVAAGCDVTETRARAAEMLGRIEAIDRSQAVIEFSLDGTIRNANKNFLDAVRYRLDQIQGRHHSMFVEPQFAASAEYRDLWTRLNRGEFISGEFKRVRADGQTLWLQASYNPILDRAGKPIAVVKYATDITQRVLESLENTGQIAAINRSQATVHFDMDGKVLWANELFLRTMGYSLGDVVGRHQSMFIDAKYRDSAEHKRFWEDLRAGKSQEGEFTRFGSGGREVRIQASYAPILDREGKPFKVVKFMRDVTDQVIKRKESQATINSTLERVLGAITSVNSQSSSAANASEDTLATVQAVASASEELSASIREISESMVSSKSAVGEVMDEALSADESTQRLGEKAAAMSKVVELIQEIAEQINLLSLNAAIESARAGDAGRGFAVVASEVKSLANQVQSATGNISKEINEMQSVSREVVKALSMIRHSVQSVQEAVAGTASAVEEQSAVTREISSNMLTATSSVGSINDSLGVMLESVELANQYARDGKEQFERIMAG